MRLAAARVYRAMGAFISGGVTPPGTGNHILLENGNTLAAENGDQLTLE